MSDELSPSEVDGLVAIGLAHDFWRGQWATVEEAHIHRPPHRLRRISDGEMFAANVGVTRIMLDEMRSGFDPERIVELLTDPNAVRVGHWVGAEMQHRDVPDLLGPYYDQWRTDVSEEADRISDRISKDGYVETLSMYAFFASTIANHWWGGPGWSFVVTAFLDQIDELPPGLPLDLQDHGVVRRLLLDAPDALGTEALEWFVHQGLGRLSGKR